MRLISHENVRICEISINFPAQKTVRIETPSGKLENSSADTRPSSLLNKDRIDITLGKISTKHVADLVFAFPAFVIQISRRECVFGGIKKGPRNLGRSQSFVHGQKVIIYLIAIRTARSLYGCT